MNYKNIVYELPVSKVIHTYGRIIGSSYLAVYDCFTSSRLEIEEIVTKPVLFIVYVSLDIHEGRVEKVGTINDGCYEIKISKYFMQDPVNKEKLETIDSNGETLPATFKDCEGLERDSIWKLEHILSRVRDHYNDVPNVWVEQMKLDV